MLDLIGTATVLILLAPMIVAIALLIRILIGRSVILAEETIGLGGTRFQRYRFRTIPQHGSASPSAPHSRTTLRSTCSQCFGESLRASGADMLPQLLNVVRGEMSLVGPHPIAFTDAQRLATEAAEILLARPGVTGMWRHAPRRLHAHATDVALDRYYVLNWSVWLDLKIVSDSLGQLCSNDTNTPHDKRAA
jgi:exopolysaccharide production protein ExoY